MRHATRPLFALQRAVHQHIDSRIDRQFPIKDRCHCSDNRHIDAARSCDLVKNARRKYAFCQFAPARF